MFRGAFSRTGLVLNALTAAAVSANTHLADSSAHDVQSIASDTAAAEAATTSAGSAASSLDSSYLQEMLNNYISRNHIGGEETADAAASHRSVNHGVDDATFASASIASPARRRASSTVMSKARRIRLAAAAQEAAEHLQEAGSPAAAMIHSQHVEQLREEERLLAVSLQRLRAERDLAVSRHDCEKELQQFRRGIRDREDAVAAMVKAKYASLREQLGVVPGEAAAAAAALSAQDAHSTLATSQSDTTTTTTTTSSATNHDPSKHAAGAIEAVAAATKPAVVYRQGALNVRDEEQAALNAGAIDVEEAMGMRFLMDMYATADAEDALEAAGAAASTSGAVGATSTAAAKRSGKRGGRAAARSSTAKVTAPATARRSVKATAARARKAATKKSPAKAKKPPMKAPAKKNTKSDKKKKTNNNKNTNVTKKKPKTTQVPSKGKKKSPSPATKKTKAAAARRSRK